MRVGEILLRDRWVRRDDLESTLHDQQIARKRLCSLLVVRGLLEPDQAARALAELHGVAAALMKHLDNRDRDLAKLIPATIARAQCALPLGRMRDGEIVICVRDPRPGLQAAFERVAQKPVLITVAAAHSLEPLVEMTYPVPQDAVRLARPSTSPATSAPTFPRAQTPPPVQHFAAGTERHTDGIVSDEVDVDLDSGPTPIPETFSLVDLDDEGVDKDFSVHDMKTPTTLPPGHAAVRPATLPPVSGTRPPTKKP